MDLHWNDPVLVRLHERLTAVIQREYEDGFTSDGRLADSAYFGSRAAVAVLEDALGLRVSDAGTIALEFSSARVGL